MTREEANNQIRSVKRWCRGHCLHAREEQVAYAERFDKGTFAEQVAPKRELEDKFRFPHGPEGSAQEVRAAAFPLIYPFGDNVSRPELTCGQDVNELIIADGKFDGENHEVICSRCGAEHQYAVRFEGLEN